MNTCDGMEEVNLEYYQIPILAVSLLFSVKADGSAYKLAIPNNSNNIKKKQSSLNAKLKMNMSINYTCSKNLNKQRSQFYTN